jgi:hypothetical protein
MSFSYSRSCLLPVEKAGLQAERKELGEEKQGWSERSLPLLLILLNPTLPKFLVP